MRLLFFILMVIIATQLYCDEKTHELYVPFVDKQVYTSDEVYYQF